MNKLMLLVSLLFFVFMLSCTKSSEDGRADWWLVHKSPSGRCYEVYVDPNARFMGMGNEVDCDDPTKSIEPVCECEFSE